MRFHYWDLNGQFFVTPRANYSFDPKWKRDIIFRLSGGMYYQPPFYRELRNLQGEINRDLRAQESYHAVLGTDYNFKAWGRPFKLIAEVYYKYMDNLVPYVIDNVRIRRIKQCPERRILDPHRFQMKAATRNAFPLEERVQFAEKLPRTHRNIVK